jgi:hypothetical protein|tara:strand:+ start:305 stop:1201 length:897 start_codon:yes stop_codon:yes gene_type:complete
MMAKFNLENYETVEDRLKLFWKDNPDGRIETDIVHITTDGTCVTIKAELYKDLTDARPVTTGTAQETKGQGGFANADAWMENCETSAIGRALANWKYQGSNKPRPSREEMSKVSDSKPAAPKKKPIVQEKVTSPSNELKQIILDMCGKDKDFATNVWKYTTDRVKVKPGMPESIVDYTEDDQKTFIDVASKYIDKQKKTFEERQGNSDVINTIIETFDGDVEVKEGDDMADIPSGDWEKDAPSEKQLNTFNNCVNKAIDNGDDELAAKAKAALSSGKITKGNIFDWVDTDTWSLKDGS